MQDEENGGDLRMPALQLLQRSEHRDMQRHKNWVSSEEFRFALPSAIKIL